MMKHIKNFLKSRGFLYLLFTVLAIPFVLDLFSGTWSHEAYEHFLKETGEFAARFLVITLLISPLRTLFPQNRLLKWLQKHKRAFGIFTFVFSALHLAGYLVEHTSVAHLLNEMVEEPSVFFGWIAFLIFVPLALTSNNLSVRLMKGRKWKNFQRLVYLAAVMVAIHWFWGEHHLNWAPVLVHFLPLLLLELYRIYNYFNRPSEGLPAYN